MRVPGLRFVLSGAIALAAWSSVAADASTLTCDPDPSCEDRCRAHAEELFRDCVSAGGATEACAERARAALAACVEENCRPDPSCEDRCRARAEEFFRSCVEAGHDREACGERAKMVLAVCLEENCVPTPTCAERCRAHSEEVLEACVAAGGDLTACAERARAALEACLLEHCEPCLCPRIFDPVCGADGKTYPNACVARCAGVEVVHPGECTRPCRCNGDCPPGDVCRDGGCRPPCEIHCFVEDPVCGSDGRTYGCGPEDAACHGVTVLHRGECRPVCERDADCGVGSLCQPAPTCSDPCGCASFCVPCACPRIFDPVCGADGKTYPNACVARCAHVEIVHRGACEGVGIRRLM